MNARVQRETEISISKAFWKYVGRTIVDEVLRGEEKEKTSQDKRMLEVKCILYGVCRCDVVRV